MDFFFSDEQDKWEEPDPFSQDSDDETPEDGNDEIPEEDRKTLRNYHGYSDGDGSLCYGPR